MPFSLKFLLSPRRDGDKDAIQGSVVTRPCSEVLRHYWSPLIHEWGGPQLKGSLHHNAAVCLFFLFCFFFPGQEAATQKKKNPSWKPHLVFPLLLCCSIKSIPLPTCKESMQFVLIDHLCRALSMSPQNTHYNGLKGCKTQLDLCQNKCYIPPGSAALQNSSLKAS